MPNAGSIRTPIYQVMTAMKGRGGGPSGVHEIANVISITTQKSIGDPAGQFEVVVDGSRSVNGVRLYEALSPNDYIEIRLGVLPQFPRLVPVMRGFIDTVRLVEDPGATPSRQIIIGGRDYGKLWSTVKLLNIYPPATSMLATLIPHLYTAESGEFIATSGVSLTAFFQFIVNRVVRPYVIMQQHKTGGAAAGGVADCTAWTDIPPALILPDLAATQWNGPVYNWIRTYQHTPWIEMFCRDEEEGPVFYLRWARLRTSDFRQISPFEETLDLRDTFHTLTYRDDDLGDHLGHTDNDVWNWFFTGNAFGGQVDAANINANFAPGFNPYIAGNSIDGFALRPLTPNINFFPVPVGATSQAIKDALAKHNQLAVTFNLWLVKMLGFQDQLENGTIVSLGWPNVKVGDELRISDTDQSYYVEGVSHRFMVNQTYTMQLTVTRGMPYNDGQGFGMAWDAMTPYTLPTTYPDLVNIVSNPNTFLPPVSTGTPT
jgi:hypothetical protein